MKNIYSLAMLTFFACRLSAQNMPEYNNSAIVWNSKANISVQLSPEETVRKDKLNSAYKIPYGALFSKKAVVKTTLQLQGPKSKARTAAEDTLKIYAKIDKDVNPLGIFKIYRATIENNNREVQVMQTSKKGNVDRSDGDFQYTIDKIAAGIFLVKVVGPKSGDELFFYIGTHETPMAKLTLGID